MDTQTTNLKSYLTSLAHVVHPLTRQHAEKMLQTLSKTIRYKSGTPNKIRYCQVCIQQDLRQCAEIFAAVIYRSDTGLASGSHKKTESKSNVGHSRPFYPSVRSTTSAFRFSGTTPPVELRSFALSARRRLKGCALRVVSS